MFILRLGMVLDRDEVILNSIRDTQFMLGLAFAVFLLGRMIRISIKTVLCALKKDFDNL